MSDKKIVLNWNDSLLYDFDLEILNDKNGWLNDRLIGFAYEYFEKEKFKKTESFLFVNPSTVQYLKLCTSIEEADICFLTPLELNEKEFVFFPITNNQNIETAGGSHWSLIVYDKKNSCFIHLDSIGSNIDVARVFYKKYKNHFKASNFIENLANFPKQSNSCDCGLYVLNGTEAIVNHINSNQNQLYLSNLNFDLLTPRYIQESRKTYTSLIISLA